MSRLAPSTETIRALFARSGNQCAFHGCTARLVNDRNQFIGQICHIEAAELGGERFNATQSDEQRRSYGNLFLLCYPHHVETNDVELYRTELLQQMKAEHEALFGQKLFQIDESLLHKVSREMDTYWKRVDELHRKHHVASDLAIEIDANASFQQVADGAADLLKDLGKIQEFLIESDRLRQLGQTVDASKGPNDFEVLYLGFTNARTMLSMTLVQLDIKYLEEFVKLNPHDLGARRRLDQKKEEFERYATSAGYVD